MVIVEESRHRIEHIEREDLDFFPEIERWLSPDQCTEAGQRMTQLRAHSRVTRMEPEQSRLRVSLVTADQRTFSAYMP